MLNQSQCVYDFIFLVFNKGGYTNEDNSRLIYFRYNETM